METIFQELPCTGCIYPQDCGECELRGYIDSGELKCEECGYPVGEGGFRLCGACLRRVGLTFREEGENSYVF
jgi:hypothetical protein